MYKYKQNTKVNGNRHMKRKYTRIVELKGNKYVKIKCIALDPKTFEPLPLNEYVIVTKCKVKKHKYNKTNKKLQRCIRWIKRRQAQDRMMKRVRKPADQVS